MLEMVEQDKLFILDASPDPEGQDVAGSFDLSGLIERINYDGDISGAVFLDFCGILLNL